MTQHNFELYESFRPTQFDSPKTIEGLDGTQYVVVASRNRDSDCRELSNFDAALRELGGENDDDVQIHRFGHWACGWVELLLAHEETHLDTLIDLSDRLEDYPILDDDDYSMRLHDEAQEVWQNYLDKERIEYIRKHRDQFAFRSLEDMLSCARGKHFRGCASELIG